jgi:3-phenylpropionate/trans-cinnamate dioxygenase ferredoxin reductase subunit
MTIRTVAIAGASLAGVTAATSLRSEGYDGAIVLLGDEPLAPYERPGLSKGYLRGEEGIEELLARPDDWYAANDVDLRTGVRVTGLDAGARAFMLDDGTAVPFDAAIAATGAANRRLDVPGAELPGVLALRTTADADAIRAAAAAGGPAVVVGMGFIGAEVAASLRGLGVEVTVVEIFSTPLQRVLGEEPGRVMERIHADHGVRMVFDDTVEAFEGGDGRLARVRTRGGRSIEAAFAVVGIGVAPNAAWWPGALAADGGIPVGTALETEIPGVFAIGDVASHDHPIFGPIVGRLRVEHYDNAVKGGEAAARSLLGAGEPFDDPHWFWSDQYDVQVQMAGIRPDDPVVVTRGSLEDRSFCRFFLDGGGVLRAAISVDWARDVRRALPLIRAQARPDPTALADPGADLRHLG